MKIDEEVNSIYYDEDEPASMKKKQSKCLKLEMPKMPEMTQVNSVSESVSEKQRKSFCVCTYT